MVQTVDKDPMSVLPLTPRNPLPYRQQLTAIRAFHTGLETLRHAGGPVTRLTLAAKWRMPSGSDHWTIDRSTNVGGA